MDGKFAIPPVFENTSMGFYEGRSWVQRGNKRFLVNRSGDVVGTRGFDRVSEFHDGLAAARIGRRWGYVGYDGEFRIEPVLKGTRPAGYPFAIGPGDFHHGLATCWDGRRWGYIDGTGAWRIQPRFSRVDDFDLPTTLVEDNGKILMIDLNGRIVRECS